MRPVFLSLTLLFWLSQVLFAETTAKEVKGETETIAVSSTVAGNLDIESSGEGFYPAGSSPKAGKWEVGAEARKLSVSATPLVEGWMEFGPEIREKGATMTAIVRGPGQGRLKSRFGAGLYGKNGFQLRVVQVSNRLQLVRRGEVLQDVAAELVPGQAYHLELSVLEDENNWKIAGRIWPYESSRPEKAMIQMRFFSDELLFPLAGRPVITATPFSGEPVSFLGATAYFGEFVTPDLDGDAEADEDLKKDKEAGEDE